MIWYILFVTVVLLGLAIVSDRSGGDRGLIFMLGTVFGGVIIAGFVLQWGNICP